MNQYRFRFKLGFSLVEMMVSIGIIVVITATVLYNHRRFNDGIALSTAAYETALAVRQAQIYGLSVSGAAGGSTPFDHAYGVRFDINNPNEILFFADENGNHTYDEGADGVIEEVEIKNQVSISDLCIYTGSLNCSSPNTIDVTFKRPKPEAMIYFNGVTDANLEHVVIKLTSPQGLTRDVEVYTSGQISTGS